MENYNLEPYDKDHRRHSYGREEAYLRAKKRLDKLVGFYWHLAVYVVVNFFLIVLIASNTEGSIWNFGTFATAFFWGIGLFFHFLGVFGPNFFFGKDWEDRKIEEFIRKEERRWE